MRAPIATTTSVNRDRPSWSQNDVRLVLFGSVRQAFVTRGWTSHFEEPTPGNGDKTHTLTISNDESTIIVTYVSPGLLLEL